MNTTWKRYKDQQGDGYARENALIWDNGAGMAGAAGNGRWAVIIDGRWVAHIDTLAEAKAEADRRIG